MFYQKFLEDLYRQGITIAYTHQNQKISKDPIVAYKISSHTVSSLQITNQLIKQQIYIFLEQGARAQLLGFDLQIDSFDLYVFVLQDAHFTMNFSCIQKLKMDCSISVYLEGDRSSADIQGLYALNGHQRVALKTYQYHAGMDTRSNLIIKGMLTGYSQASYYGLIKIDEYATRAHASQINKNIVLSGNAQVISVPSIEVLQHDVQCCHGSAIGKFDASNIWYLQSKGIEPLCAQKLLIGSYFQDVLEGLDNKDEVLDIVCQKMI